MTTREIERAGWFDYFQALNHRLVGRPVRLQIVGLELGDQREGELVPLRGITLSRKGTDAGGIDLTLGRLGGEIDHRIAHPVRIFEQLDDAGELVCLDIEDREGRKSLLFLEPSVALQQPQPPT